MAEGEPGASKRSARGPARPRRGAAVQGGSRRRGGSVPRLPRRRSQRCRGGGRPGEGAGPRRGGLDQFEAAPRADRHYIGRREGDCPVMRQPRSCRGTLFRVSAWVTLLAFCLSCATTKVPPISGTGAAFKPEPDEARLWKQADEEEGKLRKEAKLYPDPL